MLCQIRVCSKSLHYWYKTNVNSLSDDIAPQRSCLSHASLKSPKPWKAHCTTEKIDKVVEEESLSWAWHILVGHVCNRKIFEYSLANRLTVNTSFLSSTEWFHWFYDNLAVKAQEQVASEGTRSGMSGWTKAVYSKAYLSARLWGSCMAYARYALGQLWLMYGQPHKRQNQVWHKCG